MALEIFSADDPLVRNGTYDREGYKPGERARIAKACARQAKGSPPMAKTKKAKDPSSKKNARSQNLPGMEDRAIKPLEDIAAAYADVRDRRIELNREESELKTAALKLMHKYEKTIYRHDGIEIRVIDGEEDVKVKVKKAGLDEANEEPSAGDEIEDADHVDA